MVHMHLIGCIYIIFFYVLPVCRMRKGFFFHIFTFSYIKYPSRLLHIIAFLHFFHELWNSNHSSMHAATAKHKLPQATEKNQWYEFLLIWWTPVFWCAILFNYHITNNMSTLGKGKPTICPVPLLHNKSFTLFKDLIDSKFNIFQRNLNSCSKQYSISDVWKYMVY